MNRKWNEKLEAERTQSLREERNLKLAEDKTAFLLEKVNTSIEQLTDEGIRICRSLADEESEHPEKLRELERKREDQLRLKERIQKAMALEFLLNSERDTNHSDLALEREIYLRETERVSKLLSEEKIALETSRADTATRDRFLAIVSHDLKSPLTAIFLGAQFIRTTVETKGIDPARISKLTQTIERSATFMERLITQLLDAERISHGKLTLTPQHHKVRELLEDSSDLFATSAQSKSIRLSFENETSQDFSAEFDFDRLLQVLSNLIGNAIKFTPSKGSIEVKAWQANSLLNISITDSGPGIAEKDLPQIFERFTQMHHDDRKGLGLGLYISKWIVEAHHGQLSVRSQIGQGTTFTISLPVSLSH